MKKITNRGFSIILSIFIILTFSALGLMFLNLLATQTDTYLKEISSTQAFYLAEAARNYALEYYINWGRDFTKETDDQFPNLTVANGRAKQFDVGRFEVTYPVRNERSATIRFTGIANPGAETQITRTIEKTFSDATTGLAQDMKNFAVYVANPYSPFKLGRPNCLSQQDYFNVQKGNVYINLSNVSNGEVVLDTCQMFGGDVYANASKITVSGVSSSFGTDDDLYIPAPAFPFTCKEGTGNACHDICTNCNSAADCNNCVGVCTPCPFWGNSRVLLLSDAPLSAPSKLAINNTYFQKELDIAALKTSGDLTIDTSSPNYSDGLKGKTIYVNGKVTIISSDTYPLKGPGSIVATGGSATYDGIKILNTGRIRDRINFIVSKGITIEDNSWLGGTYNFGNPNRLEGAGVVLYSKLNSTPTMTLANNTKVKARLLQPSGLTEIDDQFWGLVYTSGIYRPGGCSMRFYGNLFIDTTYLGQYLCGLFYGGPAPDQGVVSELPLKAHGLYNISETPAGYYEP